MASRKSFDRVLERRASTHEAVDRDGDVGFGGVLEVSGEAVGF